MLRKLSSNTETRIREAATRFLAAVPLEESTVIFDGPGIGCTSHTLLLGYLGIDRLMRLEAVHSFSSSTYGTMFLLAKHLGMVTLRKEDAFGWNRANQRRHGLDYPGRFLARVPSLIRRGFAFSNERTFEALAFSVTLEFVQKQVRTLPPSLHFWIYNQTDKRLEDVHAGNAAFAHWTMGDVIRAVVAVPYLYEPFEKDGKRFVDPMFAPTVRDVFRKLRSEKNVLFWNMTYSSVKANVLAVKGHESSNGLRRIIFDEVLFLLGIDNPEFDACIARGLFEIRPLPEPG